MTNGFNVLKQWSGKLWSVASGVSTLITFIGLNIDLKKPSLTFPVLHGINKLNTILDIGALTAIFYGILWTIADDKVFKWHYGSGGGKEMPRGMAAIVLSSTLILPLIFVPIAFQRVVSMNLLLPQHLIGGVIIIFSGAIGHLIMYGTDSNIYTGLRIRIAKTKVGAISFGRFLGMELTYTIVYFATIVIPYRMIVLSSYPIMEQLNLSRLLLSMGFFFFGQTTFGYLKQDSLTDKRWLQVEGVISGILLSIALCTAMYL